MQTKKLFVFCSFIAIVQWGCSVFQGASNPYSLAPKKPSKAWEPTKEFCTKPVFDIPVFSEAVTQGELSLAEMIDLALLNNPQTKQTWEEARAASADYGQSLQNYFPLATIDASYNRQRTPTLLNEDFFINEITTYQVQANFSYLFLDFGQTRATSQAALYALYQADLTHSSSLQTIIQMVMTDYYLYLYARELKDADEVDVSNAMLIFKAATERLRTGMGDMGDVVQAKTTLLQSQLTLTSQKQALHNAYTTLTTEIGAPPNIKLSVLNFPDEIQDVAFKELEELVNIAKYNRPEFLAQYANVESKKQSLIAANRQYYPTVSGTFEIGKTWFGGGSSDDYDYNGLVSFSFPLFEGFFLQNGVKLAKANLATEESALKQLELNIMQELSDYMHDLKYAKERLGYAKDFLASANEDFTINLSKYKVGTATILDVTNAQANVADAQAKYIEAKKDWYVSLANLAFATGCLHPPKNIKFQEEAHEKTVHR